MGDTKMKKLSLFLLAMVPSLWAQSTDSCVFCGIARGEREVSVVYQDDKVMAFLDHAPINTGHTLVIPIAHRENLVDAEPELAREMMVVAQKVGNSFAKAGIRTEAYQLHMNNGEMVQHVKHAHLHVYPRYKGDFPGDSVVRLASQRERVERPALNEIAGRLRRTLELNDLFEAYYEEGLKLEPWRATVAGDPRYNHLFPNTLTDEYRQQQREYYSKFLQKVKTFDREALVLSEQLNYDTLVWECEIGLAELGFPGELMPITQFRGMHLQVAIWAGGTSAQPFKTVRDYENWLGRLDGFADWCATAVERMKEGVEKGYVLPRALTEKMIPQLARMAAGPAEKHPFYAPIQNIPVEFGTEDKARLEKSYREMLRRRIIPAFARLHDYTRGKYLRASRQSSGIAEIPRGAEFYDLQIKTYTTLELKPEDVHELGLKEVKRIHGEMEKVKEQVGFKGTLRQFFEHVRTKKELMQFNRPEQVISNFHAIHKKMEYSLEQLFNVTPRTAFEVRRTEAFREKSAAAQYMAGSLDGTRPGIFYVPIPDVEKYNMFRDESLFLHEAIPGHHYQVSLQRENATLPKFRRTGGNSAYAEGWALYCESLGKELGLYQDPYQYFGMLSAEIHRAIRLVVDTGIHAKGWTREQGIAYSLENEAAPESSIISEIERYMAIPGQALSYKIGQLKMLELRNRAQNALGSEFDLAKFHSAVLDGGSLPLKVLERKIDRWITEQRTTPERK